MRHDCETNDHSPVQLPPGDVRCCANATSETDIVTSLLSLGVLIDYSIHRFPSSKSTLIKPSGTEALEVYPYRASKIQDIHKAHKSSQAVLVKPSKAAKQKHRASFIRLSPPPETVSPG
jgi:hypothetical protein